MIWIRMKSKKQRTYFQNLEPYADFKKLMEEVKRRGYIFYQSVGKEEKDEGKK